MGRPSVATARRRQIFEATLRCLAEYGAPATTLDRIAQEAGIARGHVRHFAGNRDDVLTEAARGFYFGEIPVAEPADPGTVTFFGISVSTLDEALAFLFGDFIDPTVENSVALAFVEAARTVPAVRDIVVSAYEGLQNALARLLAAEFPDARAEERDDVAYAVLAVAIGTVFLEDVRRSPDRAQRARAVAHRLIGGLRNGER